MKHNIIDEMNKRKAVNLLTVIYALVLTVLSYALQMYQFTALEEVHIFLYDSDWIYATLCQPGGAACLLASVGSQMFICRYAGPLIAGVLYWLTIWSLCSATKRLDAPIWSSALAVLPCLCVMLCLENSAYMLQGTAALTIVSVMLWIFTVVARRSGLYAATAYGAVLAAATYWMAGPAAIALSVCCMIYLAAMDARHAGKALLLALAIPAAACATAAIGYSTGCTDTVAQAFTPAMYYDMGSTYYMYLYAMGAVVIYVLAAALLPKEKEKSRTSRSMAYALLLMAVLTLAGWRYYGMVHSQSNYENQQQRYYARHGMWDAIAAMPYRGEATPYTSYRFLALAQQGQLTQSVGAYRPFISYIFENKPKVKKRDQQVYSDLWYACDYMAAARKAAFDTDIVTPGRFNPYETLKLAEINIVYGDYAVAEKLITALEKTLYYRKPAGELRRYLYDDQAVDADPRLGPKRRAIAQGEDYLSPKGIQRDLAYIISTNPGQTAARQMYETFLILTNQHETE